MNRAIKIGGTLVVLAFVALSFYPASPGYVTPTTEPVVYDAEKAEAALRELEEIMREQEELRRDLKRFEELLDAYERGELKSA